MYLPFSSTMFTVDDEMLRDNDKQLGNVLIVILNVLLPSLMTSSIISVSNDEDVAPAVIVTLNTEDVTL